MSEILRYVSDAFVVLGIFFAFAGTVGLLRMPDAFCRMQSSTNIATLGLYGAVIGGLVKAVSMILEGHELGWTMLVKIALIGLFSILANPIGGHSIAQAAYRKGVEHTEFVCDKYGEDEFDD